MTSNIPTRMGLYLVEENAIRDIVGREALIAQEIVGRGQIKLDDPFAVQFYLPAVGENDLERLNNMETEIKEMSVRWTGKCPRPIPMVPRVLAKAEFYAMPDVKDYIATGGLPFGLNMETVEVMGYRPKEHRYFLIADGDPGQTEYLERTICANLDYFTGKKICLDGGDRFSDYADVFDMIVGSGDYSAFITELIGTLEKRFENKTAEHEPIFVYIPDSHGFADRSLLDEDRMQKLLRQAQGVNIHLLFHGEKAKIESSYDAVTRALRANPPAGMVGSKLNEQEFVKVKSDYSEPMLEPDQHHWFSGRFVVKIKLISE